MTLDYQRITKWIRDALYYAGCRPNELTDTVQDTWLALLSRQGLDKASSQKHYVQAAATNTIRDKMKADAAQKRANCRTVPIGDHEDQYPLRNATVNFEQRLLDREELKIAITEAMDRVGDRRWSIVRLKAQGYTQREITHQTGFTRRQVERVAENLKG